MLFKKYKQSIKEYKKSDDVKYKKMTTNINELGTNHCHIIGLLPYPTCMLLPQLLFILIPFS